MTEIVIEAVQHIDLGPSVKRREQVLARFWDMMRTADVRRGEIRVKQVRQSNRGAGSYDVFYMVHAKDDQSQGTNVKELEEDLEAAERAAMARRIQGAEY